MLRSSQDELHELAREQEVRLVGARTERRNLAIPRHVLQRGCFPLQLAKHGGDHLQSLQWC